MSPIEAVSEQDLERGHVVGYRVTSLIRNCPPPRNTVGPYICSYSRVLRRCDFWLVGYPCTHGDKSIEVLHGRLQSSSRHMSGQSDQDVENSKYKGGKKHDKDMFLRRPRFEGLANHRSERNLKRAARLSTGLPRL